MNLNVVHGGLNLIKDVNVEKLEGGKERKEQIIQELFSLIIDQQIPKIQKLLEIIENRYQSPKQHRLAFQDALNRLTPEEKANFHRFSHYYSQTIEKCVDHPYLLTALLTSGVKVVPTKDLTINQAIERSAQFINSEAKTQLKTAGFHIDIGMEPQGDDRFPFNEIKDAFNENDRESSRSALRILFKGRLLQDLIPILPKYKIYNDCLSHLSRFPEFFNTLPIRNRPGWLRATGNAEVDKKILLCMIEHGNFPAFKSMITTGGFDPDILLTPKELASALNTIKNPGALFRTFVIVWKQAPIIANDAMSHLSEEQITNNKKAIYVLKDELNLSSDDEAAKMLNRIVNRDLREKSASPLVSAAAYSKPAPSAPPLEEDTEIEDVDQVEGGIRSERPSSPAASLPSSEAMQPSAPTPPEQGKIGEGEQEDSLQPGLLSASPPEGEPEQ